MEKIRKELNDSGDTENVLAAGKLKEFVSDLLVYEIEDLDDTIAQLESRQKDLETDIKEKTLAAEEARARLDATQKQLEELQAEHMRIQGELGREQGANSELLKQIEELKRQLFEKD